VHDPPDLRRREVVLVRELRHGQAGEEMLDRDLPVNRIQRAVAVQQRDDQRIVQAFCEPADGPANGAGGALERPGDLAVARPGPERQIQQDFVIFLEQRDAVPQAGWNLSRGRLEGAAAFEHDGSRDVHGCFPQPPERISPAAV
jgi:hypothetical protein